MLCSVVKLKQNVGGLGSGKVNRLSQNWKYPSAYNIWPR